MLRITGQPSSFPALCAIELMLRRANATLLTFEEPLHAAQMDNRDPCSAFRRFAQMSVPGFASEVSFFRQTIAIVTEKTFLVAEPGNISYNTIPTIPPELAGSSLVARLAGPTKPMAMYQTGENEFLLVYDWGACFTTRCEFEPVASCMWLTPRWRDQSRRRLYAVECDSHLRGIPTSPSASL